MLPIRLIRYPAPYGAIRLLWRRRWELTLNWRWRYLSLGGPTRYLNLWAPNGRHPRGFAEWGGTRGPGEAGYRGC